MSHAHRILMSIVVLSLLVAALAPTTSASVLAYQITSSGDLLSGPYADGQPGDFMLENDRVAVVISAIGHSQYHAVSGGNIIDAALASDRVDALGNLYTYFDDDWPRQADYDALQIIDDGSGGGPAVIRVSGVDSDNHLLTVITEYSLSDGAAGASLTTTVTNTGGGTYDNFELGDAFHWGGCLSFVPGYGFSLPGETSEAWLAGTAEEVSYGYASPPETLWGPHGNAWSDVNVTTVSLGPGGSAFYTRYFAVGGRDIASVATVIHEISGIATGAVECLVSGESRNEPVSGAAIDAYDDLGSYYLQMETDAEGFASATLPPGDWRLLASALGYHSEETWLSVVEGETAGYDFTLISNGFEIPAIGDTLTVIQRPLLNVPALVTPGDTLEIACVADPAASGWAAELSRGEMRIPLAFSAANYDPTTLWWTVSAIVPEVPLFELYDLGVTADGGIEDETRNAVRVIPEFREDYYFIHLTDPHLPTKLYHYEGGADTDTSEIVDLREVIADVNIINPEFVLLTGDLLNEGELEDYLSLRYYTRAQRLLTEFQTPVFLTAGNHDIGGWDATPPPAGTARRDWWRFFGWKRLDDPPPGAPWYTQNYSFDYGPVHYVALEAYDNYDMWRSEIYGADSFTAGQLQWLADDLAAADGSTARVLFYHYDFSNQINLNQLGVEMALWGHIHHDEGSISSPPYDLATNNVCSGERSYRLVRVVEGVLQPSATISAGSAGQNLNVEYTPANDGTSLEVTAEITNGFSERFEQAQLRFVMPPEAGEFQVTGGELFQVDESDSFAICYVAVDILPSTTQMVTITLDPSNVSGSEGLPPGLHLRQNQPNPCSSGTQVSFALPQAERVRLAIYDLTGREVVLLVDGFRSAGNTLSLGRGVTNGAGRSLRVHIWRV